MARIFTSGFETGDTSDFATPTGQSIISSSPTPFTGDFCLQSNGTAQIDLGSSYTEIYLAFAHYPMNFSTTHLSLIDEDGITSHLALVTPNNSWAPQIKRGSTVLDTSTKSFTENAWHQLEFYAKIDNSSGVATLRFSGAQTATFSGDTSNGANNNIKYIRFASAYGSGQYNIYDDLVINDTTTSYNNSWPGNVRLLPLRPSGAGDSTDLNASAGSNYECVDEDTASNSDYVYSTVAEDHDLYALEDLTLPTNSVITNVIAVAWAGLDSGSGSIANIIKSDATEDEGATHALTTNFAPFSECYPLDPDGDVAWVDAQIDALQAGVKIK